MREESLKTQRFMTMLGDCNSIGVGNDGDKEIKSLVDCCILLFSYSGLIDCSQ